MATALTGTATPALPIVSEQVTDIQIVVQINTAAALPVFNCGPPPGLPITFPCNQGDSVTIRQENINAVGGGPVSDQLTVTANTVAPPTKVPSKAGQPTVVFALAATAAK